MANPRTSLKRARKETESRESRARNDRVVTEDRELTDDERVDLLRRSFFQSSLPDLPKIPGYHVCWLTTTNSRDPIHGRLRLGYQLIKAEEIPGWEHMGLKTGDYTGMVGVNEMIAAKLPIHLYEAYMREVHHDAQAREEESIYNNAIGAGEQAAQAARRGGKLKGPVIDAGTEELGQAREPPMFSKDDLEG